MYFFLFTEHTELVKRNFTFICLFTDIDGAPTRLQGYIMAG